MEGDNENSDEETLVPIVPAADNDVFSPGFCSLLDSAFKLTAAAPQESIPVPDTG